MDNISPAWLTVITVLSSGLFSWLVAQANNRWQAKRVPSLNQKDQMDALSSAMKLAGMDLDEQIALKEEAKVLRMEVKDLRDMVERGVVRVTTVTEVSLGAKPKAEIISVESVRIQKTDMPVVQ